jgi:hypothetical protein
LLYLDTVFNSVITLVSLSVFILDPNRIVDSAGSVSIFSPNILVLIGKLCLNQTIFALIQVNHFPHCLS